MSNTKEPNQFIFDGKLSERDSDGNISRTLNTDNLVAGNGIIIDKTDDENITVESDLGLKIVNGQLCVTYEKEVEV